MGEVFKARDPLIGRMVALKVITSALVGRPELLERFYQEARSAGALQHPNIVTIYELGKEDDIPYIAMEYLGGESLERMIARQAPLPLSKKVGYIVQICRALDYAHKHGVVHRDIKPGNIMVTSEDAVKVVDFGIARLVDASKTQTGTLIGTVGYMSPQQLRGEHADERSDIWAVGVLFYELLSYHRPFQGDNPAALMMKIISHEPQPLAELVPECTPELDAVVGKMLAKEATDRYQTMDEALFDLDPLWKRLQQQKIHELVAESHRLIESQDLQTAQQLLRDALHLDSSHWEAKTLLEKVSLELRRLQVLPKIEEQLVKGRDLLKQGKLPEAKAEIQAALQLDSTFPPARELLTEVEQALQRVRQIEEKLRDSKQSLAEGSLTQADRRLDEVLSLDPDNPQANDLRKQIREEIGRRERRKRFVDTMAAARESWSQLRYGECIALLSDLQKDFPAEAEVAQLLETARHDKAEQSRQQKLSDVRSLLAKQRHDEAREMLAVLVREFPQDPAVQNLITLSSQEQGALARQQHLQGELATLRALVNQRKFDEALGRGQRLLAEFPQEFEVAEVINFARAELHRAEQARIIKSRIETVRGLLAKGNYLEAIRGADQALAEFPREAGLSALRDNALVRLREKERREELDRRIREVKSKIEGAQLTDAIELAKETIATLGSDTNVSRLLRAAEVERAAREKRKEEVQKRERQEKEALEQKKVEQERELAAAHALLKEGKVEEAVQLLNLAVDFLLLEPSDPRILAFRAEIERTKKEIGSGSHPPLAPAAPPPEPVAPPAAASSPPASPVEGPTLLQATLLAPTPVPPAEVLERAPGPSAIAPPDETSSAVFAAAGVAEPSPQPAAMQPAPEPAAPPAPAVSAPVEEPLEATLEINAPVAEVPAPSVVLPAPPAEPRATAVPSVVAPPARRPIAPIAVAGVVLLLVAAGAIYFSMRRAPSQAPAQPPVSQTAIPRSPQPGPAAAPAQPPPNPLEQQQRQLMDEAQKLAVQGNYSAALQSAGQALKLNGPLQEDLQGLRAQIQKDMNDKAAHEELRNENRLWQQATGYFRADRLDRAARGFQQVTGLAGGLHKADAENYLNSLIPEARKSDHLYAQAQSLARKTNDERSLQQASQDLRQVIDSGGPRADQAARLQAGVQSQLAELQSQRQFQQLVDRFHSPTSNNPEALRNLQAQFRSLENAGGPLGAQARDYAETRIPAELNGLAKPASPPATPAAPAPSKNIVWAVTLNTDPTRAKWSGPLTAGQTVSEAYVQSGLQLLSHPLPYELVQRAANNGKSFRVLLSVDAQGRVTGGKVVSGDSAAGQAIVQAAQQAWRFSPAKVNNTVVATAITVSLEFEY